MSEERSFVAVVVHKCIFDSFVGCVLGISGFSSFVLIAGSVRRILSLFNLLVAH